MRHDGYHAVYKGLVRHVGSHSRPASVLLDLRAAFDTVNYEVLLKRLYTDVGIRGKALDWFKFYLIGRSQRIGVQGTMSRQFDLDCGVPQGSCL